MFCMKCGAKNPDGSKFCSGCGASMAKIPQTTEADPQNKSAQQTVQPPMPTPPRPLLPSEPQPPTGENVRPDSMNYGGIRCPRCRSNQISTTTKTTSRTTQSGYKDGLGCLGFLLLGPLGLLCGLCGMGEKTKTKNTDYFHCNECGHDFLTFDEMKQTLKKQEFICYWVIVGAALLTVLFFLGGGLEGLIPAAVGVVAVILVKKLREEYREIEEKGIEASCYQNNQS